jgi:hypothetical protein
VPSLLTKKITGRWIISPTRWNLALTDQITRRFYNEPATCSDGAYSFYIARRA